MSGIIAILPCIERCSKCRKQRHICCDGPRTARWCKKCCRCKSCGCNTSKTKE